jgi:glycine/D-amino acid oxidase-like deaminating enzyme
VGLQFKATIPIISNYHFSIWPSLARDLPAIAYPKAIVPLSFQLHASLAEEHSGSKRWGYRRLHVGQLSAEGRASVEPSNGAAVHPPNSVDRVSLQKRSGDALAQLKAAGLPHDLDWVSGDCVRGYDAMGDPSNTAQVHPYQFTTSMAELAREKGAQVILGRATRIIDSSGSVTGVEYIPHESSDPQTLQATDIVVSAGPWTPSVYPPAPIAALRAHSVTIRPKQPVSGYALFTEIAMPATKRSGRPQHVTPEIYARPDGEVYACGEGDRLIPLPPTTADVETDPKRCQAIIDHVTSISEELAAGDVTARQACYLPNVEGVATQGPLVGKTNVTGLMLAAGHTCWGIQNGPGTGKVVSELLFEGEAKSANVKSLDPRKVL